MPAKSLRKKFVSRAMLARKRRRKGDTTSGLEKKVHAILDRAGIAYKTQYAVGRCHSDLFISPKLLIEVNGCYYHSCPKCYEDDTSEHRQKRMKDKKRYKFFLQQGFGLLLLWEHEINTLDEGVVIAKIRRRMTKGSE